MTQFNEIVGKVPSVDEALNTQEVDTSGPIEITLEEAEALLSRAVEERGADYVYRIPVIDGESTCSYFDQATQAPSCIVGHVLAYKGLTFMDLSGEGLNTYANVEALSDLEVIKVDNETLALLHIAQSEQDAGMPWGRVVEEALKTYEDTAKGYETEGYDEPSLHYFF
jgi:hypothetical protein